MHTNIFSITVSQTRIQINGNIKNKVHIETITNAIQSTQKDYKFSHLHIYDSFIVTSEMIALLLKNIVKDKLHIKVTVYNKDIYRQLQELQLLSILNVGLNNINNNKRNRSE